MLEDYVVGSNGDVERKIRTMRAQKKWNECLLIREEKQ